MNSTMDQDTDTKIDRIVKITIAKKIRALMKCDIPLNDDDLLTNKICQSKYEKSIGDSFFQVPVKEDVSNERSFLKIKRKYWDREPMLVDSKRSIKGKIFTRLLMRYVVLESLGGERLFYDTVYERYSSQLSSMYQYHNKGILVFFQSYNDTNTFKLEFWIPPDKTNDKLYEYWERKNNFPFHGIRTRVVVVPKQYKFWTLEAEFDINDPTDSSSVFQLFYDFVEHLNVQSHNSLQYFRLINKRYENNNKTFDHALAMLIQPGQNIYNVIIFDPHGNSNKDVETFINFMKIHQTESESGLPNTIEIYHHETSCPQNFQSVWNDQIGYCVLYQLMWFDCVMNVLFNIEKYNQEFQTIEQRSERIEQTTEHLQRQIKEVPIHLWIQKVSHYLNQIDDIVKIVYKPFESDAFQIEKIKQEIILRFWYKFEEDYRKFFPDSAAELEKFIQDDLKIDNPESIQALHALEYNLYQPIIGKGMYANDLMFDTIPNLPMLNGFYIDKDGNFFKGSEQPYQNYDEIGLTDSDHVDHERTVEDVILKRYIGEKLKKACTSDSQCKNKKLAMICDKFEGNKLGSCIPEKKRILEKCNQNQECLSDHCNSDICRMKRTSNNFIDVDNYVSNLKQLQIDKSNQSKFDKLKQDILNSEILDFLKKDINELGILDKLLGNKLEEPFKNEDVIEDVAEGEKWNDDDWDKYYNYHLENRNSNKRIKI